MNVKPCPICGKLPCVNDFISKGSGKKKFVVRCSELENDIIKHDLTCYGFTEEEAVGNWNTRFTRQPVWENKQEGVWTLQGVHDVFQIDLLDDLYQAMRNDDYDSEFEAFATLEEAKVYLEGLYFKDIEDVMEFLEG